ncbi:MAG: hypothetical protein WCS94_14885 [Verrucomicrobiota bacterium]
MKLFVILVLAMALNALADELPIKISLLDKSVLHVRVRLVTDNLAEQVRAAQSTNLTAGTILDLRSADGSSLPVIDDLAQQKFPLIILVNRETRGTAAALASQLRMSGPAVVIGSADSPKNLTPDITVALDANDEKKFLENPYFTLPKSTLASRTNDLLPFVDHMSEAELVRKRVKDGEDAGDASLTPRGAPAQLLIRDPVLARAVDLLKALAVLHSPQS